LKSQLKDAAGRVNLRFSPTAPKSLHHIRHYRWDSGKDKPLKDGEHDHAVDALRYLIINLIELKRGGWSKAQVVGLPR